MMEKYCAFGSVGYWRFGTLIEDNKDFYVIKPDFNGPREYWIKECVKVYDTEEEARTETERWE